MPSTEKGVARFERVLEDLFIDRADDGDDEDESRSADRDNYKLGMALVRFYREIMRIATGDEGHWGDVAELFSDDDIRLLDEEVDL